MKFNPWSKAWILVRPSNPSMEKYLVPNTFPCLSKMVWPEFKSCFIDYIPFGNFHKISRGRCQLVWSENKANSAETELGNRHGWNYFVTIWKCELFLSESQYSILSSFRSFSNISAAFAARIKINDIFKIRMNRAPEICHHISI